MKVLFSVGVWGKDYLRVFVEYSLASQLSPENIPKLAERNELTYHIATTRSDAEWLQRHPMIAHLSQYCWIDWDYFEDLSGNASFVTDGFDGEKYSFLSFLQNLAIKKSLKYDALLLNYADFIWSDGSVTQAVELLSKGTDLLLTFCLPVDRDRGLLRLKNFKSDPNGFLQLSPRAGARLAIECLHRDAALRYWNGPKFTSVPTYLLWEVGQEGVIVRAYHQTALALRPQPENPIYRNGIQYGSLDGHFTSLLADSCRVGFADNSDKVFVFSLFHARSSTAVRGRVTREESLRDCLSRAVSQTQRKFSEVPIEVRSDYSDGQRWSEVARDSLSAIEKIHQETSDNFKVLDDVVGEIDAKGAPRTDSDNPDVTLAKPRFFPRPHIVGLIVTSLYRGIFVRLASGKLGDYLRAVLGPRRSRALRLFCERIIKVIVGVRQNQSAPTLNWQPYSIAQAARFVSQLAVRSVRRLRRMNVMALRRAVSPMQPPADDELLQLYSAGTTEDVIGRYATLSGAAEVIPYLVVPARAVSCFQAGVALERIIGKMSDLTTLDRALLTAEAALREVVKAVPVWSEGHRALGRNLWFQGRIDESLACFAEGERSLKHMAEIAGWEPNALVFLPRNTIHVIGLMGHIDGIVKRKILLNDHRHYILLAPESEIVNRVFLDYWKEHIKIVTDPSEIARLAVLEPVYSVNLSWVMPQGSGGVLHIHPGIARVQRQWRQEKREPLLKLEEAHQELLRSQKSRWGMTNDDWFVCLHVRSAGFYTEEKGTAQHFRNTPIDDYYPMIKFIIESGGWVVRMGDASMPPLDIGAFGGLGNRVIDYAHAAEHSPELDVALCASCRLFVSSPSGLHTVAHAFGRPVCPVNFPMYAGFPWHPGEIFIPQRYFSRRLGRVLTLEEILSLRLIHADHQFLLDRVGVELMRNDPVDILEAVREALDPEHYSIPGADIAFKVRAAFEQSNRTYGADISGTLGLHFAATYAQELGSEISAGKIAPEDIFQGRQ